MRERDRVDAAILGGTELPFLFRDGPTPAVPLLDTTRVHVERAVEYLLSEG
jgi:aspartate/glutamate racemase